jgi:uncharacterized metal-binding protein YceD (DUF177 family)
MNLPAVLAASCTFRLTREGREAVLARGAFRAKVTQTCIFCLDNFDAPVEEVFQARFVPVGEETEKVGSGIGRLIPFEGNVIDLGETAAELCLGLPSTLIRGCRG